MKISKSNKYTRSVALGLSLLVSTSLLSGCNDDRHLHVYEKQGVVKLIESENRIVDGYIKTEDTIPYDKDLDYELQVLDYYGLVRVNDNVSYIENSMLENKPYIEYEYVYYKEDVKHYFDVNNIYTIGDSDNDYPMLKDFQGYYIGNPKQNIKDVCLKGYNQVFELINDLSE